MPTLAMAIAAVYRLAEPDIAQNLCRIYDALEALALWLCLAIYTEPLSMSELVSNAAPASVVAFVLPLLRGFFCLKTWEVNW